MQMTLEQRNAIQASDCSILVSAAAGTGKTTVLVNRILNIIKSETRSVNITDLIVITYTRAAARELKLRIQNQLSDLISQDIHNRHLQRQAMLCDYAQISTIHSFCANIIRENAGLLGISPDFRIAEEYESNELKDYIIDEVLEHSFSKFEDINFQSIAELLCSSSGDQSLKNSVLTIYDKLRGCPAPEMWISNRLDRLLSDTDADISHTVWGEYILKYVNDAVYYAYTLASKLFSESKNDNQLTQKFKENSELIYYYIKNIFDSLHLSWNEIRNALSVNFPILRNSKKHDRSDLISLRKQCVNIIKDIKIYFYNSEEVLRNDISWSVSPLFGLYRLVNEFEINYQASKIKRNILDFSDLEQYTLKLLYDFKNNRRTDFAVELSSRYYEVMIDEYQDVNPIQELIIECISNNKSNLFLVGDVKQSIYRFRLADPTIFLNKYLAFPDYSVNSHQNSKIILSQNFRSSLEIINSINNIFDKLMSLRIGGVQYGPRESLKSGLNNQSNINSFLQYDILFSPKAKRDDLRVKEAKYISSIILNMIQNKDTVLVDGHKKAVTYGDIALLLRNEKNISKFYTDALSDFGIPFSIEGGEDLLSLDEIQLVIHFLNIIDNPHQDIPLINVLKSPLYRFTYDELMAIRESSPNGDFFSALINYSKSDYKAKSFISELEEYRNVSSELKSDQLLVFFYEKSNIVSILEACHYGKNPEYYLTEFLEYASGYEKNDYQGLFRFNCHIQYRMAHGGISVTAISSENSVKIMTIHKSKGLEFPVVILADSSAEFSTVDNRTPVFFDKELGIGLEHFDYNKKIHYSSFAKQVIGIKQRLEACSEEMRILYVALTRAKERLYIVSSTSDISNYQKIQQNGSDYSLLPFNLEHMTSFDSWIFSAINCIMKIPQITENSISAKSDPFRFHLYYLDSVNNPFEQVPSTEKICSDKDNKIVIEESYTIPDYLPYRDAYSVSLPSKVTVTELNDHNDNKTSSMSSYSAIKTEMQQTNRIKSVEKGNAVHTALQFLDYKNCLETNNLQNEIKRLVDCHYLTNEQADEIEIEKFITLFSSDIGQKMINNFVNREFRFSILIKASQLFDTNCSDKVLFQGIIDCWFEDSQGITLIDFKTDRVTKYNLNKKVSNYKKQVQLYAFALKEITGKNVNKAYLFFYDIGKFIEIEI